MKKRAIRILAGLVSAVLLQAVPLGCYSSDTVASLNDWTASTAGSLVQILVKDALDGYVASISDPALDVPIAEQQH